MGASGDLDAAEAERQLAAAVAREGEAVAAVAQGGRSPSGDASAADALGRGTALVVYALRRAHAAGVHDARLAELTGWDAGAIRAALEEPA